VAQELDGTELASSMLAVMREQEKSLPDSNPDELSTAPKQHHLFVCKGIFKIKFVTSLIPNPAISIAVI